MMVLVRVTVSQVLRSTYKMKEDFPGSPVVRNPIQAKPMQGIWV